MRVEVEDISLVVGVLSFNEKRAFVVMRERAFKVQ